MSELIQRMPAVVQTIRLSDLVDIAILSIVIYKLLWMVRKTSSGRVLRGIMIVVVAIWASAEFNLYATSFVLNRVVEYAILVLVILFQPEIRRFLERVGSSRMSKVFVQPPEAAHDIDSAISQTVEAYTSLSKDKVGALMVFERANLLDEVIKTGTATSSYPLEPIAVDKNFRGKPEQNPQQCIGCAACVNACPSNALTVETDLATGELAWEFNLGHCIFCGRCEEVCPTAAIKLSQEYELAVWKKEDFLQQSRFALCNCRVCNRPFAVQKEIDYAIALLKHNGDSRAENHRESFETCPECKRQKCLVPSDRIELTRHMKEAI